MRQVFVFDKTGNKVAQAIVEPRYLESEKDWINKMLLRSPELDGLAFVVDWDTQQLIMVRKND